MSQRARDTWEPPSGHSLGELSLQEGRSCWEAGLDSGLCPSRTTKPAVAFVFNFTLAGRTRAVITLVPMFGLPLDDDIPCHHSTEGRSSGGG